MCLNELIDGFYLEGERIADTKAPMDVPIDKRWERHKFNARLVNPANRRKLDIIIVGAEVQVLLRKRQLLWVKPVIMCDVLYPRLTASCIPLQLKGGINAAKNYRNDNDSVYRLFYDTVKGR